MDVTSALFTFAVTVSALAPMRPEEAVAPMSIDGPSAPRPKALVPLYAGFAVLQGFDTYTTSTSLSRGAREGNLVMRPLAGKTIASAVVKAAATAGSIYFIERAWKRNRKGAIIVMTAINVATAAVVAHNTRVAKAMR